MRKYILFVSTLLCTTVFCGCTVTSNVTPMSLFVNTIREVSIDLQNDGFSLMSTETDRSNVKTHVPEYYDHFEHGFSGDNSIDYIYTNTYHFENEEGDKMTYSVSYQTGFDHSKGLPFVREAYVKGCETSNPKHYEHLCGDASPIHKFDTLPKNATVRH